MAERRILWTTVDPRGLSISLAEDVWLKILDTHPELSAFPDQLRLTVESPEEIYFDPKSTKQRLTNAQMFLYYRGNIKIGTDKRKWLLAVVKVVIELEKQQGYVQTAHLTGRKKGRAVLEWNS